MLLQVGDAINLTDRNLAEIDKSLRAMGNDPDLFALRGYALKNMYQYSKNLFALLRSRLTGSR
jgi:hypothetical protein